MRLPQIAARRPNRHSRGTQSESNIRDLVKLLDEETGGVASEQRERLESIEEELEEVNRRLGGIVYSIPTPEVFPIVSHR